MGLDVMMSDINIRVAKCKGWKVEQVGEWFFLIDPSEPTEPYTFQKGDEEGLWDDVPSFTTNIFYALSLIEGMQYTLSSEIVNHKVVYTVWLREDGFKAGVEDVTLPLAITYCWNKLQDFKVHD